MLKQKKPEKKQTEKSKKISDKEFESKVVELSKKGLTSEKIGLELSKRGIHPKEHDKKISRILKEKKIYISPDMKNIGKKLEDVVKHLERNKQDKRAKRDKDRIFAKLRKLKKYFKEI